MNKCILIISLLTLAIAVQVQMQVNTIFDLLEDTVCEIEINTEISYE